MSNIAGNDHGPVDSSPVRPLVTILTPCFNEEANVRPLAEAVRKVFEALPEFEYRHLFIDNHSQDATGSILRQLAAEDQHIQVILNARNFGHVRSPAHGLFQAQGDAVISLVADFQDPPELIPQFLEKWRAGNLIVLGQKKSAEESRLFYAARSLYYATLNRISEVKLYQHITGFGLYDRRVIEILRQIDDPYPYIRGQISEIGIEAALIQYHQPLRRRGITKNNFYTLYDVAMLGLTAHSKVFIRLATMVGFTLSFLSLLIALGYLAMKLLFWYQYPAGMAPVVIGLFFFGFVQLFFIGLIGEYVAAVLTQVRKIPRVVETARFNLEGESRSSVSNSLGSHPPREA